MPKGYCYLFMYRPGGCPSLRSGRGWIRGRSRGTRRASPRLQTGSSWRPPPGGGVTLQAAEAPWPPSRNRCSPRCRCRLSSPVCPRCCCVQQQPQQDQESRTVKTSGRGSSPQMQQRPGPGQDDGERQHGSYLRSGAGSSGSGSSNRHYLKHAGMQRGTDVRPAGWMGHGGELLALGPARQRAGRKAWALGHGIPPSWR